MSKPITFLAAPDIGIVLRPGTCVPWPGNPNPGNPDPGNPGTPGEPGAPGQSLTIPAARFITNDYTLVPGDNLGTIVATSNLPIVITIPTGMPSGWVEVVQGGSAPVLFEGAEGVQLDVPPGRRPGTNGIKTIAKLTRLTSLLWLTGGPALAQPAAPDIYYGASPTVNLTAENIPTLGQGMSKASLPVTVTYDCTGGRYPFIAYPASWPATSSAKIGAFTFSDLVSSEVQIPNGLGVTVLYRVLRFRGIQRASNMQVTW